MSDKLTLLFDDRCSLSIDFIRRTQTETIVNALLTKRLDSNFFLEVSSLFTFGRFHCSLNPAVITELLSSNLNRLLRVTHFQRISHELDN